MNSHVPIIAILTSNALMGVGLRSILERMLPFAVFKVCSDFSQIESSEPEELFHIFVSANEVVEHHQFFELRRNKTIVLTNGTPNAQLLQEYPQINISASQESIEEALRQLHSSAHGQKHGDHRGGTPPTSEILSPREIEVLRLLVDGLLNKEIAEKLSISITTVITHRKNIVEKLGVKSLAGLTIYAVMKRYINI